MDALDKTSTMLRDPPMKKALVKMHIEPTPVSVLSTSEPYADPMRAFVQKTYGVKTATLNPEPFQTSVRLVSPNRRRFKFFGNAGGGLNCPVSDLATGTEKCAGQPAPTKGDGTACVGETWRDMGQKGAAIRNLTGVGRVPMKSDFVNATGSNSRRTRREERGKVRERGFRSIGHRNLHTLSWYEGGRNRGKRKEGAKEGRGCQGRIKISR